MALSSLEGGQRRVPTLKLLKEYSRYCRKFWRRMMRDNNILEEFNALHQASTVQFIENINIEGRVFGRFPPELLKKMSTHCLVMQNHRFGISPGGLQANKDLCNFFRILTTSVDKENKVYVSSVQAQHYPITALQWHPEGMVVDVKIQSSLTPFQFEV